MAETSETAATDIREKVLIILAKVRPGLQMDGGDVELVDITEDGTVNLKLQGACSGCPMAMMTLHGWIEKEIKNNIPEVTNVRAVNVPTQPKPAG
jgi:Fe-S cluster biogenesis protein NfuA